MQILSDVITRYRLQFTTIPFMSFLVYDSFLEVSSYTFYSLVLSRIIVSFFFLCSLNYDIFSASSIDYGHICIQVIVLKYVGKLLLN